MNSICLTCINTDCHLAGGQTAAVIACSDYKKRKVVTNYDFIRSLSMAEMAEMLTVGSHNFSCKECWEANNWTHGDQCDQCCTQHCVKWLGQPLKSEET